MSNELVLLITCATLSIYLTTSDDFITKEGLKWKEEHYPMELLSQAEVRAKSDKYISDFRATMTGAQFSGVFSNNTVLQKEPYLSALYGICDSPNVDIVVNIKQIDGSFSDKLTTKSMSNNDWKVLLNQAMPNGGNYSITLECDKCQNPTNMAVLYNVTFGDVFYCSGQSNMQLHMHFTFSRNETYDAINNGKYWNMRYMKINKIDTSNATYVVPPMTNPSNQWQQIRPEITNISLGYSLDTFSATCWYFAQSLVDNYGKDDSNIGNIGLIDATVGG
eukprot:34046_1